MTLASVRRAVLCKADCRRDNAKTSNGSVTSTKGRVTAVTTYPGDFEDYLLFHKTGDGAICSSPSPQRRISQGRVAERLDSLDQEERHLRQSPGDADWMNSVKEKKAAKKSDMNTASNVQTGQATQNDQAPETQTPQPLPVAEANSTASQPEKPTVVSTPPEENSQSFVEPTMAGNDSEHKSKIIVPEVVTMNDGRQEHRWPRLTVSVLPYCQDNFEFQKMIDFSRTAAGFIQFANVPTQVSSTAANMSKFVHQIEQMGTCKPNILTRESSVYPGNQCTTTAVPTPVSCSQNIPSEPISTSKALSGTLERASIENGAGVQALSTPQQSQFRRSGTINQQHQRMSAESALISLRKRQQAPLIRKFGRHTKPLHDQWLPAGSNFSPRLGSVVRDACEKASSTLNTIPLLSLASASRVQTKSTEVCVDRVKLKKYEENRGGPAIQAVYGKDAVNSHHEAPQEEVVLADDVPQWANTPGITAPKVVRQKGCTPPYPDVSTYDTIRAPGIVMPPIPSFSVASVLQRPKACGHVERDTSATLMSYDSSDIQSSIKVGIAEAIIAANLPAPPVAVASALGFVQQPWYSELRSTFKEQLLAQYIETGYLQADPRNCAAVGINGHGTDGSYAPLSFTDPARANVRVARVLRDEADAMTYNFPEETN